MESTAMILLALKMAFASSLGVMFGWQPMPDAALDEDGPKIEYIVQIEPELAATLQEGQSIPITSDIPEGIGPIGRIRIVVGRDELPREKVVTNFKPWPTRQSHKGQSRAAIVETQYTVPPVQASGTGGRYGNQATANNSILPPGGSVAGNSVTGNSAAATTNPFGRTLQQGAQQARNLAADVKQPILPPSGNELFGQSGASRGVQNAINNTTNQLNRGLQRGIEQVADRTGQQLRQTADNVGQGVRNAADRFGRTLTPEQSTLNNRQNRSTATILPPSSTATSQTGKGLRIDQPPQQPPARQQQFTAPPARFAQASPSRTTPRSQPGVFDAPWPQTTGSLPAVNTVSNPSPSRPNYQASQPPAQSSQWPRNDTSNRDYSDLASRPSDNRSARFPAQTTTGYQKNYNTASTGNEGPSLPATEYQPVVEKPVSSQYPETYQSSRSPVPEIHDPRRTQPYADDAQYTSETQGYQQGERDGKTLFPLLLSWVLLSGSGAGNLYLFWSYLDVRNKYRGVVHSSPRRNDRYDD